MWQFIAAMVMLVISHLLAPKPKKAKPPAAQDMEDPKAEAGVPVKVVFGTMTVKGGNILWYGDKQKEELDV